MYAYECSPPSFGSKTVVQLGSNRDIQILEEPRRNSFGLEDSLFQSDFWWSAEIVLLTRGTEKEYWLGSYYSDFLLKRQHMFTKLGQTFIDSSEAIEMILYS